MAKTFTLDTSSFRRALRNAPDAIGRGAQNALIDIKNDWKAEAIDNAPIQSGTLRQNIDANIFNPGIEGYIEIKANATREHGRFNYAYYIHEGKGNAVTGEKKFLEKPAQENQEKWRRWLEEEIQNELAREGWR